MYNPNHKTKQLSNWNLDVAWGFVKKELSVEDDVDASQSSGDMDLYMESQQQCTAADELFMYRKLVVPVKIKDVISWWYGLSSTFPNIYMKANNTLSSNGSAAPVDASERIFCSTKKTVLGL